MNLVGHVTGAMGLGVATRNTLAMLDAAGRGVAAIDVDAGPKGADTTWARAIRSSPEAPHPVNWFQLNPPEVKALFCDGPRRLDPLRRANVCVPFWELPRLPIAGGWRSILGMMDLVLAPSRFVLDAVRASLPRTPVVHYPQTVVLPADIAPRRASFGLPPDAVLFHLAADATSDLERKNPMAAILAFREAFPDGGAAGLVVKLGRTRTGHAWADPAAVVAAAAGHPGIRIVEANLPYREALELAASCDVSVSLHRAEGLGLGMLEAMTMGKPVIATGWSGNMDFMDASDACLVGFDLVPVRARHPAYDPRVAGEGQVWAEPRLADAVGWMRSLASDATLRATIGDRARESALALHRRVLGGDVLRAVDAVLEGLHAPGGRLVRNWSWRRFLMDAAVRCIVRRARRRLRAKVA